MGLSHSKHHQYYEEQKRIHGYQKASSRRARSATVTAHTRKISTSSNNKQSLNAHRQGRKARPKVVYYPKDYFETAAENIPNNPNKNDIYYSLGPQRARSQAKLPLSYKQTPAFYSQYDINGKPIQPGKADSHFQHLPQTISIVVSPPIEQKKQQIARPARNYGSNNNAFKSEVNSKKITQNAVSKVDPSSQLPVESRKTHYFQNNPQPQQQYYCRNPQSGQIRNNSIKIKSQKIIVNNNQSAYGLETVRNLVDVYKERNMSMRSPNYRGPYGNQHGSMY